MADIYEQYDAAFKSVEAYVICKDGERVATIAFKYGNAVTAYVHWIGLEMVKGRVGGGGYDRRSGACNDASRKLLAMFQGPQSVPYRARALDGGFQAFNEALKDGASGAGFDRCLRDAGFTVLQAV